MSTGSAGVLADRNSGRPRTGMSGVRIGLVLGGGGVLGLAYHAGALAALEHDLGWDARTADVIVGTSAGAIAATLLRRGVPATDLAALSVGARSRATPAAVVDVVNRPTEFPALSLRSFVRVPRPPGPAVVMKWMRRPWRFDPLSAFVSVLADGELDLTTLAAEQGRAVGAEWPEDALWLTAVRQRDMRRVVFGRDSMPPLSLAVMASCSVPGYFRPVTVDEVPYLDGGVRSPTNADLLRSSGVDVVIVSSPMSGRQLGRFGVDAAIRRHAKRKLISEIATLEAAGIRTAVLEPGPEVTTLVGHDFMSQERVADIVGAAFLDAGAQLRTADLQSIATRDSRRRRVPVRP